MKFKKGGEYHGSKKESSKKESSSKEESNQEKRQKEIVLLGNRKTNNPEVLVTAGLFVYK